MASRKDNDTQRGERERAPRHPKEEGRKTRLTFNSPISDQQRKHLAARKQWVKIVKATGLSQGYGTRKRRILIKEEDKVKADETQTQQRWRPRRDDDGRDWSGGQTKN